MACCRSKKETQYCDISVSRVTPTTPTTSSAASSRAPSLLSETYVSVEDVATSASARAEEAAGSVTYLDLNLDAERRPAVDTEELYVSSHFADEPLYQFYTASIIKVIQHCHR